MGAFDIDAREAFPGGLQGMQKLIGNYASPEAALHDFDEHAPRARDYMIDQHRRLTGEMFSSPFDEAGKSRDNALMQAAMSGLSVSVNDNWRGGDVISDAAAVERVFPREKPKAAGPLAGAGAAGEAGIATSQLNPSPSLLRHDARAAALQTKMMIDKFGNRNWRNPLALPNPTKLGLNREVYDSAEMRYIRQHHPELEAAAYEKSEGRSLEDDIKYDRLHQLKQEEAQYDVLKSIDNLQIDEDTGEPYQTKMVKDEFDAKGGYKAVRMPLDATQKAVWEARGGTKGWLGVDVKGTKTDLSMYATTPEDQEKVRARGQEILEKNPNIQRSQAFNMAAQQLKDEAEGKKTKTSTGLFNTTPGPADVTGTLTQLDLGEYLAGLSHVGTGITNTGISAMNIFPRSVNAFAHATDTDIPRQLLLPHLPKYNYRPSNKLIKQRAKTTRFLDRVVEGF